MSCPTRLDLAWSTSQHTRKSKILTRLSNAQKKNGPLLFSLLGQGFQDVGLTEWTRVVAKRCLNNADCTKAKFDECIRDYLKAVTGFPNIGDQLIRWLCTAKKLALMPMHEFMWREVQLLSYLKSDYLHQTMEVPIAQEKSEQIFFAQPKAHQNKFTNLKLTVPSTQNDCLLQAVSGNQQGSWRS